MKAATQTRNAKTLLTFLHSEISGGQGVGNWCVEHWQDLRHSVTTSGLAPLSHSSDTALLATLKALEEDEQVFDPLLTAWTLINSRALEEFPEQAANQCPLCALSPGRDKDWIRGVLTVVGTWAAEQHLVVVH